MGLTDVFLCSLLLSYYSVMHCEDIVTPPEATTSCGKVQGVWDTKDSRLGSFLGIQYGKPPTGKSRWQPPQPAACWSGTKKATKVGHSCIQQFHVNGVPTTSEDCLYLDVFSRFLGNSSLVPVIAWIHGGGLTVGDSNQFYGRPRNMASLEDVVLVAFNYRLSSLGFLALPELSAADPRGTSGNYGFLDQQLALKWIQENIIYFGGDKNKVTLIGQSSGGTSIFGLLSSPGSNGLFHGAISLSGSYNVSMGLQQAYTQNTQLITSKTNCTVPGPERLECLLALPAAELAPLSWGVVPVRPASLSGQHYPGLTVVDGVTITHTLADALHTGLVDVPIIFQTTLAEGQAFGATQNRTIYDMSVPEFEKWRGDYMHTKGWPATVGQKFSQVYQQEIDEPLGVGNGYQIWIADYSFFCGGLMQGYHAASGKKQTPTYITLAKQPPGHLINAGGPFHVNQSVHGWDYAAGFHCWDLYHVWGGYNPAIPVYQPTDGDYQFSGNLRRDWMELARTGKVSNLVPFSSEGFPTQYNLGVYDKNITGNIVGYGSARCNMYNDPEIQMWSNNFWCTN